MIYLNYSISLTNLFYLFIIITYINVLLNLVLCSKVFQIKSASKLKLHYYCSCTYYKTTCAVISRIVLEVFSTELNIEAFMIDVCKVVLLQFGLLSTR